jgi:hypothetical protein
MNLQLTKIKSDLPKILGAVVFFALLIWFIADGINKPEPVKKDSTAALVDSFRVENQRRIEQNRLLFLELKDSIIAEQRRQYNLMRTVVEVSKQAKRKDNEINTYTPYQRDSAYVKCIARIRAKYREGRFNR